MYFLFNRDPNCLNTLKSFEDSIKWAVDGTFSTDDIEEAKLAVFASVIYICQNPSSISNAYQTV